MKFNLIVGNPPYDRSLHLKILEHMLPFANEIVWISPVRWLQDPLAKYKKNSDMLKYRDTILKRIRDLDIIGSNDATELFGGEDVLVLKTDLAIYHLAEDGDSNIGNSTDFSNSIIDKIVESPYHGTPTIPLKSSKGTFCLLNKILAERNGIGTSKEFVELVRRPDTYGRWFHDHKSEKNNLTVDECKATNTRSIHGKTSEWPVVEFDTEEECKNYYNFTQTELVKYVYWTCKRGAQVQLRFIPYMPTYTRPWTDEDLFNFFNITEEEQKIIHNTVKEFSK